MGKTAQWRECEARKEPIMSFIFVSSLKVEFEPEKGTGEVNKRRRKG